MYSSNQRRGDFDNKPEGQMQLFFLSPIGTLLASKKIRDDALLFTMFTTRLSSKMEKDTWVMNIRKIGMRPMSSMSSSTHGADIREFSTRDVFTHVKKRLVIPKVGPATTLLDCMDGHYQLLSAF